MNNKTTTKEILEAQFKVKLQKVYGEMLDSMAIPTGDIAPAQAWAMTDAEDALAGVVADWLLSNIGG